MWYVYMLLCQDGSFYIGATTNLARRFMAHQKGLGGAYTRSHPPQKIIYSESFPDRSSALIREYQLKQFTKTQKQQLIKVYHKS